MYKINPMLLLHSGLFFSACAIKDCSVHYTSFHSQRRLGTDYVLSVSSLLAAIALRTPLCSSSLAKLTLSSLDSRIPFRRLMQIRLKRRSQQIELDLLHLKIGQKPSINLLYQHPLKMVCG